MIIKKRKVGRPKTPEHLYRDKLEGVRVPRWMIRWLKNHPGSRGRLIEKGLNAVITEKEEIKWKRAS